LQTRLAPIERFTLQNMSSSTAVLLTGASGFLGLHILDALLSHGYHVIAAVRSPSRETDVRTVAKSHPNRKVSFVYVADISADGAYDEVFKTHGEITAVIHTASPVNMSAKDPLEDVVYPAINGVTNLLRAIKAYGPQVARLVVTSSIVTMYNVEKPSPSGTVITEKSWVDVTLADVHTSQWSAYTVSKVFAEKAVWKFVEEESPNFKVTTLTPPLIFGAVLGDVKSADALNESSAIVHKVLSGKIPQGYVAEYVDAGDLAKAHVLAIEKPQLAGKRLLVTPGSFTAKQIVEAAQQFGFAVQPNAEVDTQKILAQRFTVDNSETRKHLGFEYVSLKQTTADVAKSFIEKGLVEVSN
jgi:nucleoside-diphosphate-sugar epimerase